MGAAACSGPAFSAVDDTATGGAGRATGGRATGGLTNGGQSTGGASGGNAQSGAGAATTGGGIGNAGGTQGAGGARTGGSAGALGTAAAGGLGLGGLLGAGGLGSGFPSTPLLDDFNRGNDELGSSWLTASEDFALRDQQLVDRTSSGMPLLWGDWFGAAQEAFANLADFGDSAEEINLVMRAQEVGTPCELLEVLYHPSRSQVSVHFCVAGEWTELTAFDAEFSRGDRLGARALANGMVIVYRNGAQLATFDAAAFPYRSGGYIGVNAYQSDAPAIWDDFGGGDVRP